MTTLRGLDDYPRPGLAVDLAILTVTRPSADPVLRLLVQDRDGPAGRALPGGFVRERATIAETTADVLRRKVGIEAGSAVRPRLLRLFDDPGRDDRSWVTSAAHALTLSEQAVAGARGDLVRVEPDGTLEGETGLLFDHDEIVRAAVDDLGARYEIRQRLIGVRPDPDGFLPEPFTLLQLRRVHEAVVGDRLHKDNFARRMKEWLVPEVKGGRVQSTTGLRGRPAALFRRAPQPAGHAEDR